MDYQESLTKMVDEICIRCPQLQISTGVTFEGLQEGGEVWEWNIAGSPMNVGKREGEKSVD